MNEGVLTTIAISGFGIAFFHSAIPTHWLPFVLTSRVQRWNRPKTIAITALAGTGHVAVTALLGFAITWFGTAVSQSIGNWLPKLAGGVLLLFGIYYLMRQFTGKGHVHFGYPHEHLHEENVAHHEHEHEHEHEHGHNHEHQHHNHSHGDEDHEHDEHGHVIHRTSDRAAILSLLAFLTFSPCEGFVPLYASGIRYGWTGFATLTIILSVGTVLGMVIFTSLTLAGLSRLRLAFLEKNESFIMGFLLCLVGIVVLLVER